MKNLETKNKIYPLLTFVALVLLHGAYFGLNLRYRYTYTDALAKVENIILYIAMILVSLLLIYARYSLVLCACAKYGRKGSKWEFGIVVFSYAISGAQQFLEYYFDESQFFEMTYKSDIISILISFAISVVVLTFLWVWTSEIWRKNQHKKKPKVPYAKIFLVTAIIQYAMQFIYQLYLLLDTIIMGEFESFMVLNVIYKFTYPLFTSAVGFVIMMLIAKFVNKKVLSYN